MASAAEKKKDNQNSTKLYNVDTNIFNKRKKEK